MYMHERGIVHRDLKLENILLGPDLHVHISDFGFANEVVEQNELLYTACGSPCYAAPELVLTRSGYHGKPADIWSCGVILYTLTAGHLPFEEESRQRTSRRVVFGDHGNPWDDEEAPINVQQLYNYIAVTPAKIPASCSSGLERLIRGMLTVDPRERMTLQDIADSPWWSAGTDTCSCIYCQRFAGRFQT